MRRIRSTVLCLITLGLMMPAASAAGRELKVSARNIPASVRQAAEAAVPGIVLDAVEIRGNDRSFVYELRGVADGKRYELEVTRDGKVLEVELDSRIALSEVPEAARKAALKALPGAKLLEAELVPAKGEDKVYELEAIKDGRKYEILVTAKGEVQKVKEDPDDDEDDEDEADY